MRLRYQLLLVSLLILCLPWAGCQYVREMENILRDEKAAALTATAQAIAAHLQGEANLFDVNASDAQWFADIDIRSVQLYLHPLSQLPNIDAHNEDWVEYGFEPISFKHQSTPFSADVYAGIKGETLYLYFHVFDTTWQAHNPQRTPAIANGDHVVLRTKSWGVVKDYYLRTSVSGDITARYINDYGAIRNEPRIFGRWRIEKNSYDLEVQMPRSVVGEQLGYAIVNQISSAGAPTSAHVTIGTALFREEPLPWVTRDDDIEKILAQYNKDNQIISVINRGHWLLAQQGQLQVVTESEESDQSSNYGLSFWLYKFALGKTFFPEWSSALNAGRIVSDEAVAALHNETQTKWYNNGAQTVARVAAPIIVDRQTVGAVLLAESTDEVLSSTQQAFTNLFSYTFLAAAVAVFGSMAYAYFLAFRIGRLIRAAENAVSEDGRIDQSVVQANVFKSTAKDEVGDLSRSYGGLLRRLREYTEYLRTLSSKLSHELRTPLAVVKSSLDNIEQEPLDEDLQRYIARARDGVNRLSNILSAMSAASHMEQSIRSSQIENINLAQLVKEVTTAYRDTYSTVEIDCQLIGVEKDFDWNGAPDLIVQMLDKLVDNAADFTGVDGAIKVALTRKEQQLILSVSNTGPLLPENMQGQLFDSLVSLREPSKAGNEQTHLGLGLYIVRLIVEFHRGRVAARNLDDDSGVIFTVTLPAT